MYSTPIFFFLSISLFVFLSSLVRVEKELVKRGKELRKGNRSGGVWEEGGANGDDGKKEVLREKKKKKKRTPRCAQSNRVMRNTEQFRCSICCEREHLCVRLCS